MPGPTHRVRRGRVRVRVCDVQLQDRSWLSADVEKLSGRLYQQLITQKNLPTNQRLTNGEFDDRLALTVELCERPTLQTFKLWLLILATC